MIVYQKPDEGERNSGEVAGEDYIQKMESYRKKLIWENILAVVVILLNILINYTVIEQIRDFNHDDCSF